MEESAVKKLVFDFHPATELELSRKRSCSQLNDDVSECSKKIRKQLQKIDLSSSSSSMDTDEDDDYSGEASTSYDGSKTASVNNVAQESQEDLQPSTSTAASRTFNKNPNVNIISVDIIKSIDEPETIEIPDDNGNEVQVDPEEVVRVIPVVETVQNSSQQDEPSNKQPTTNRIVISDSSEDEAQDDTNNNRRHSDASYTSTYSFTNVNGAGCGNRSSFGGGRYHHSHRFRRHHNERPQRANSFQDQSREFQRIHAENMRRIHQHASHAREHAARAIRASTSAIPDLVSQFRAHFQPLFRVADINQHVFSPFRRWKGLKRVIDFGAGLIFSNTIL